MKVEYREIGAAIVTHLNAVLPDWIRATQSVQEALSLRKEKVSVHVAYDSFSHDEDHSQSPVTPARDADYILGINARADSIDGQDELLDETVSLLEEACNPAEPGTGKGHLFPPYGRMEIERSIAMSASPKVISEQAGLTTSVRVVVRIMED